MLPKEVSFCACMGPQINPLTGERFPACPCAMTYTEEEKAALAIEAEEANERLRAAFANIFEWLPK